MSKNPDFRWTPRLRRRAPPKARPRQRVSVMAVMLTLMIGTVAVLAIYAYHRQRQVQTDVHVIRPQPDADGLDLPYGKGRLQLRFAGHAEARRLSIAMIGPDGVRLPMPRGAVFTLETVTEAGARSRIAFRVEGDRLVSTKPVVKLTDRSSLVVEAAGVRHVLVLDEHPPLAALPHDGVAGAPHKANTEAEALVVADENRGQK